MQHKSGLEPSSVRFSSVNKAFSDSAAVHDKVGPSSRKEERVGMSTRDKRCAQMQIRLQKMRV